MHDVQEKWESESTGILVAATILGSIRAYVDGSIYSLTDKSLHIASAHVPGIVLNVEAMKSFERIGNAEIPEDLKEWFGDKCESILVLKLLGAALFIGEKTAQ